VLIRDVIDDELEAGVQRQEIRTGGRWISAVERGNRLLRQFEARQSGPIIHPANVPRQVPLNKRGGSQYLHHQ